MWESMLKNVAEALASRHTDSRPWASVTNPLHHAGLPSRKIRAVAIAPHALEWREWHVSKGTSLVNPLAISRTWRKACVVLDRRWG